MLAQETNLRYKKKNFMYKDVQLSTIYNNNKKQPEIGECLSKLFYIHTMKYYVTIKNIFEELITGDIFESSCSVEAGGTYQYTNC